MVYDFSEDSKGEIKPEDSNFWRLPDLGDRLASVIVDFGVLGLVSSLVLAPVTRQIYISKQVGEKADVALLYFLSVFLFVLSGILYQTFFVWKQGGTLGQKAFGIRVVNLWDKKQPEFMTALTRAIFWWVDTLLCGIPHLAVFSNTQRRPMHDRLADTIVVSVKASSSASQATGLWLSVGKFSVVFAFFLGVVFLGLELTSRFHQIEALEDWQDEEANVVADECDEVTEALESWPEDTSRLSVAMALFSAEGVPPDCLEVEAYNSFKENKELDLAYLTRAFSRNEDPELSDAYLKKVCEVVKPESETCVFSQLIENWTEKNWDAATEIFTSILPGSRVYVKIWAIKHFERTKEFAKELQLIDALGARKPLANFLGTHRAVALWGLHKTSEARAAAVATMENMSSADRVNLSGWFCYRELLDDCSNANAVACKAFNEDIEDNSESLTQAGVAVTLVRLEECSKGDKANYEELADRIPGEDAENLIQGSKLVSQNKITEAAEVFKNLTKEDSDKVYAADAQMRLVQALESEKELGEVIVEWKGMDHSIWEWRRLGRVLFDRFVKLGLNSQAFSLGTQILDHDPSDAELFKDVIVAGYRGGLKLEAWNLLKTHNERSIASEESYGEVESALKQQFLAPPPPTLPKKVNK